MVVHTTITLSGYKMKISGSLILCATCLVFAGCSTIQPAAYKKSSVNLGGADLSNGSMTVWDSSLSAAVYVPRATTRILANGEKITEHEPKMCAQAARVAREDESRASAQADAEVLKAFATGPLSNLTTNIPEGDKVSAIAGVNQTAKLLIETSKATSYLDTGMFYLCQLAANSDLDSDGIEKIAVALFKSAESLDSGQ